MRCLRTVKTAFEFVLGLSLTLAWGANAQARELIDATGAKVRVKDHPVRIVTLAPSLGELAADLSGGDVSRIVGVSEYTDFPEALSKVESIGSYAKFNLEKVVSLKPDLVLGTLDGNSKDQVGRLREMGLPVVVVATSNLQQIEESMRLVGQAMDAAKTGDRMASKLKQSVDAIRARALKEAKIRGNPQVLLQIGDDPLVVVGKVSFLHEALGIVGARNSYGDLDARYPRPALEDVLKRDPDVILVLALGKDLAPFEKMAAKWGAYSKLKSVRSKNVRVLQGDAILRPTLRLIEGLSILERAIHGQK